MKRLISCIILLLLSCQADATLSIVGSCGTPPAKGVALDGGYAYLANDGGLYKINLASFSVVGSCVTPPAKGVALDGGYAYLANDGGLYKINLATLAIPGSIAIPPAKGVAIGGGYTYAATDVGLYKINLATLAFAGGIGTPPAKAVAIDGGFAYVATDVVLYKINLATLAVVGAIGTPLAKGVTIGGGFAYVATDGGVYKIDLATFSLSGSFPMFPNAKAIALDGSFLYVATDTGVYKLSLSPFGIVGFCPTPPAKGVAVEDGFIYAATDVGLLKLADINCIEGYKLDPLGRGLSGWTIFIDRDGDRILGPGEPSVVTDSSGHWKICGLDPFALANVSEVAQPGWQPSIPPEGWQTVIVQPNNGTIGVNFTNQNITCIDGYKVDSFGNKLSGWTIFVDNDDDGTLDPGESNDTTDSSGYWQICGLNASSSVNVTEVSQPGWWPSSPSTGRQAVTVQPDNGTDYVNFTNQNLTCIDGYKLDSFGNKLSGWTIFVDKDSDGILDAGEPSNITDPSGYWQICELNASSTVNVTELSQPGWRPSSPSTGWQAVTVQPDNATADVNFTNQNVTCIDGYKLDTFGNGLPGWTFFVDRNWDSKLTPGEPNAITNASGYWQICGLDAGEFIGVAEEIKLGWRRFNPPPGASWPLLTVQPNNETDYINITNQNITCISGFKLDGCGEPLEGWTIFVDSDRNGELDSGEPASVTDADGRWQICDLEAGTVVRVAEQAKAGWRASQPSTGWQDITVQPANATAYVNFTNIQLLCISGYKYNACGGQPLSGWKIQVFNRTNGIKMGEATTNSSGYWRVCNLVPGLYWVNETLKVGWLNPNPSQVVSLGCQNKTNVNFWNIIPLCISGYKFDACNGQPLSGWKIEIFDIETGIKYGESITNGTGYWQVCNLSMRPNRPYWAKETLKAGWWSANPIKGVDVRCMPVTGVNFTNQKLLCISGYKKDNCTGAPLPGWNITLQNATGTTSQLTGPDGKYQFCNLKPGDYTITEEDQSGYTTVNVVANPVTLNCSNITNQNFTNQKLLCISGYKLLDCGKGFTLSGWTITLKNSSYNVSTTTNDTGYYEFCGLLPGSYTLSETVPPGWSAVTSPVLSPTLLCNNNLTNQNFTNIKKFCISGYKRDNCTKAGLPDCTVTLNNSSYTVNTTTNAAGYYEFCGLIPGAYTVTETVQPGWTAKTSPILSLDLNCRFGNLTNKNFTNQKLLCINGTKTDGHTGLPLAGWTINLQKASNFSDPPVIATNTTDSSGKYSFCGLESGDYTVCERMKDDWKSVTDECIYVELECEDEVVNFKNIPKLCINGSKTNNCTGEGLENWTIELRDEAGALINTTETNANGDYSFCGLEAGNYTVCELLQGGWKNVTARCIDVVLDIENSEDNNFLNDPPVCINGTKINDCTDEGIAGWKIFLYDAVGNRIGDAVTDAHGRYSFCNLTQGIYYVCEEEREGWVQVHDERRSIGPSNSTSEPITCNMPWCDDNCICVNLDCQGAVVDFRNVPKSLCINGSKINNCTGGGLSGWGIYLYDATGKNIAATQTDRNGHYSFCGLAPGQYRVCEEIRDGYIPVTHINNSGASCLPESCTCDACNNCIPVILDCKNSEENDFENIPPTSIKGKVIDDCTGLGLKGWTVKLFDDKGVQLTTKTTGADGSYAFTSSTTGGLKLTAGSLYWVCEAVKDGYTPVTYHANNTSRSASQEYCVPVFLDCGETEVDDFENIPPLLISGHEFNHCTGQGLDGWTVHLKDGSGNILETTTTDDAGYYQFSGRQPGWYTVCEDSIPEGWTSFRDDPNSPAMALPGTSAASADCETPKCIVVRLDSCEDGADNDFENIPAFCIKGNINSSTDEALPENFQVKIENSDASQILSEPADANGDYSFCNLKAGTYTVCLDEPGWTADEPCVIVYLDCMDEEDVNFDVYKGRNPMIPGIAQPAITLDDSRGAVDPGTIAGEPSTITESDTGGDEPPAARPTTNPEIA